MHCRNAQQLITDAVTGNLSAEQHESLESHCGECAACREEWDALRALWHQIGDVTVPAPAADLPAQFSRRIGAGQGGVVPWGYGRRVLIAAAIGLLLLTGSVGFGLGRWTASGGASAPGGPAFLLLLHGQAQQENRTGVEVVAEYAEWARRLDDDGRLLDAHRLLAPVGWVEPGTDGRRDTRIATAGRGAVSGFFLITADDLSHALELAGEGPHAGYGGRIEVRPLAR